MTDPEGTVPEVRDPPLDDQDDTGRQGVVRRRLINVGILCAIWIVPGLVGGFSLSVLAAGPESVSTVSLPRALFWQFLAWMPWAAWTAVAIWLVRVLPFKRGVWQRAVLVHCAVGVCVASFQVLLAVVLDRWLWPGPIDATWPEHIRSAYLRLSDFEVVTYMAVVAAGVGLDYFRRYREGQLAAERLRTQVAQAQLLALRSQLNPHFLFNALNGVIALMDRDVPAAQRMVVRLGDLLRLSLSAEDAEVPLARELSLAELYLEIERIRFGDRLTVAIDVPTELLQVPVPNLVLQPLVENAIVHGVGPQPGAGTVTIQASRADGAICLRVIDDGAGLRQNGSPKGHGIGVANTRARLAAMYGASASLTLRDAIDGGCIAELCLPRSHMNPGSGAG